MNGTKQTKIAVLYHANCADGFASAFAFWLNYKDQAIYIPVEYQKPFPELDLNFEWEVYIVDFSYPYAELICIAEWDHIKSLVILDHHKSAQADLEKFKEWSEGQRANVNIIYSKENSGCVLCWEYLNYTPDDIVPVLFRYVQDRDLWQFNLKFSREFNKAIASYPFSFQIWELLIQMPTEQLISEGQALVRYSNNQIDRAVKNTHFMNIGGYPDIPAVNSCMLMSEIGERLYTDWPHAKFVAIHFKQKDNNHLFSLRSKGEFDVSEVAKKYGGGGHKNSAGFTITAKDYEKQYH